MKTLFSVIAAAAVLGFAAPTSAKADHFCNGQTRVVGYTSWGTPIIAVYQVVGYDRCGQPIGRWVTQPVAPQPGYGHSHGHNHGYGGHSHGYSGHGYRPSHGHSRSGVSFSFGFGR
ncbi:MAG: hypothetical protein JNM65_02995 [Verrucomicrobiaceae bacterium]|nr:hypothetical protein [Verrucomicrobiaceae bacterium]